MKKIERIMNKGKQDLKKWKRKRRTGRETIYKEEKGRQ
jgi:hypothetical protein